MVNIMKLIRNTEYTVTTTVGELIKELEKYDKDLPVYCDGNIIDVTLESDDFVLLKSDDDALDIMIVT